ncbi:hypothetical protein [Pedobacter sp. CFBP9032]|uniref:hypothetical protein n=1 Tax=Pedobacter sp. CFBP9032 TaxID=3096539 RepID=UPI0039C9BABA
MKTDVIIEICIDSQERLCIKPSTARLVLIYRTATEVHWDANGHFLFSPKPREWTYLDWYIHINEVVSNECHYKLVLSDETIWTNIPEKLKRQIIEVK